MVVSPIQTSFAAGEVSPRLRGRIDTDVYRKALAFSENWLHRPEGPILMRAGSVYAGESLDVPRLIPFKTSTGDYVLALSNGTLEIFSQATGAIVSGFVANMFTNGQLDADATGWNLGGGSAWQVGGFVRVPGGGGAAMLQRIAVPTVVGRSYTLKFRARKTTTAGNIRAQNLFIDDLVTTTACTTQWATFSYSFVSTHVNDTLQFYSLDANAFDIDDLVLIDNTVATTASIVAPWTSAQLAAVQYDQDLTKSRMILVHPNVAPRILTRTVHGTWELYAAPFISTPVAWGGTNYPAAVEWGFQGRSWFAATPDEPNGIIASKSGYPFDLTTGAAPGDALSFLASLRGALRWMRGQKSLLMGAEQIEQSASGSSGGVIAPGDIDLRDESAFGSAPVQAVHLGDQVLFVSRDRRHVRALDFSLERDGWVARALTSLADHFTGPGIAELHFTYSPIPVIFAVLQGGDVIGCTYDRAEQVLAWFRCGFGGAVASAAIVESASGGELWIAITRAGGAYIERMPLHEAAEVDVPPRTPEGYAFEFNVVPPSTAAGAFFNLARASGPWSVSDIGLMITFNAGGKVQVSKLSAGGVATVCILETLSAATVADLQVGSLGDGEFSTSRPGICYLDSARASVVNADGTFPGLDHLNGETVRVLVGGALEPDQVVAGGQVLVDVALAGRTIAVGLAYTAKSVTLPPEGGNPRGSAAGSKKRYAKVGLILNDSALPLVNGWRAGPDRTPAMPMDTPEARMTGKTSTVSLGWDDDGQLTIEQDLPFRTEVCAVYGVLVTNEV